MSTTVILAEKHSQAAAIATAMGLAGMAGNYQGQRYLLTWAAGHLLEFEEPDKAKPGANWYDPASLLPLPTSPRLQPGPKAGDALAKTTRALATADAIIIATDPDREGEAIGRYIVAYARHQAPIKRLWLTGGLDPASVQKALANLRPGETTLGLLRAQQGRAVADWLYIFATRAHTALGRAGGLGPLLGQGAGKASVVSVGRVQTPTLRLLVDRHDAIAAFTPTDHFRPQLHVAQGALKATLDYAPVLSDTCRNQARPGVAWQDLPKGPSRPLFTDRPNAEAFLGRLNALPGINLEVQAKKALNPAPLPLALVDLQRAANQAHKLSAADTLAIAQSLYTAGLISYPRTEHRELPTAAYADAPTILSMLAAYGLAPAADASAYITHAHKAPPAYSSKAMEHHGLMPTKKQPAGLPARDQSVYDLIAKRYIQAHLPPAQVERSRILANAPVVGLLGDNPALFLLEGEQVLSPGWLAAFPTPGKTPPPALRSGPAQITSTSLASAKTKAPPHYTEATLLAAMKNAARFVTGDEARILRQANGLGTPATRANIIETLLARGYITREKGAVLKAAPKGCELVARVPASLSDVAMTARWEAALSAIEAMPDAQAVPARNSFIIEQADHLTQIIKAIVTRLSASRTRRCGRCA